jgi:oligosaccharide repeat unit polymerase
MEVERRTAHRLLLIAVALAILTPYLAPRFNAGPALAMSASVALLAIWVIRSRAPFFDWFHPIGLFAVNFFLLFVTSGVIILVGVSYIVNSVYGPSPDSVIALINQATLYADSFLLAVYAGFLLGRKKTRTGESTVLAPGLESWETRKLPQLRLAAWLALGCSYIGCVSLTVIFGGIGGIVADPMAVIESRGTFWPFVLMWASLWSFGIFYISYLQQEKRRYLVALLLTLPTMVFEFLAGGTKMAVIFPSVCFLILRHYLIRRLNWKFIPKLAAFTLFVFAVGYSYRPSGFGSGDFLTGLANYREDKTALLETFAGRFYGIDSFMLVLDETQHGYPLQWGKTLEDLLYFYVPRTFWPNKPESYSLTFGREFLGTTSKAGEAFFTPTLPGELYLNFGVVGVLVGGCIMGMLLWRLYANLILGPGRGVQHVLVYAVTVPLAALVLSGPIASTIEYLVLRCSCFALFYWFAGKMLRAPAKSKLSQPMLAPRESR